MIESNELQAMIAGYPYRVLIVDDDTIHLPLERAILQPPKYAVTEASRSRGIAMLSTESFDVMLLDKSMPDMNDDLSSELFAGIARTSALDWNSKGIK